jgi:hypothetical protein
VLCTTELLFWVQIPLIHVSKQFPAKRTAEVRWCTPHTWTDSDHALVPKWICVLWCTYRLLNSSNVSRRRLLSERPCTA